MAGTEKRRSTEPRNTVTIGVTATADSTFEWREEGAQVIEAVYLAAYETFEDVTADLPRFIADGQSCRLILSTRRGALQTAEFFNTIRGIPNKHWGAERAGSKRECNGP